MTQTINVAQVAAASGGVVDVKVAKIVLGGVTIGQLTLQNTSLDIKSGSAFAQNVRTIMHLEFELDWWWDVGFASDSGTDDIGGLSIPFNVGDIAIPSLNDIPLNIPSVVGNNVTAQVQPITGFDLGGGSFAGVTAASISIPQGGFTLAGLQVASLSLASLDVPRTSVGSVAIQDFHPNASLSLPSLELGPIVLTSANAGNIATTNTIAFNGSASKQSGPSFDFGVFGGTLSVVPTFFVSIGSLLLNGVSLSATVQHAILQSVGVPVDVQGIELSSVNVDNLVATNVTL
jgi:hypothetical protein